MSETAALAADIASKALTCTLGACCEPPIGNKTRTSPSQNPIFKRNHMPLPRDKLLEEFPRIMNLAEGFEHRVRGGTLIFTSFKLNCRRIFRKFERIWGRGVGALRSRNAKSPYLASDRLSTLICGRFTPIGPPRRQLATDRSPFGTNTVDPAPQNRCRAAIDGRP